MAWAATKAKAKFSEMLDRAETEGPQIVRRRKQEFIVLKREQQNEPDVSTVFRKPKQNVAELLRSSPLRGSVTDLRPLARDSSAEEDARPFVSAWDALAPSFDERFDIVFPRLRGELRKVGLG